MDKFFLFLSKGFVISFFAYVVLLVSLGYVKNTICHRIEKIIIPVIAVMEVFFIPLLILAVLDGFKWLQHFL